MSHMSTLLERAARKRECFDPTNKDHVEEFKFFKQNNRWKNGCPFFLEEPFMDIPTMCSQKYINHSL